jgi:hypothetical protein
MWQIDGASIPRQRLGKRLLTLLATAGYEFQRFLRNGFLSNSVTRNKYEESQRVKPATQ